MSERLKGSDVSITWGDRIFFAKLDTVFIVDEEVKKSKPLGLIEATGSFEFEMMDEWDKFIEKIQQHEPKFDVTAVTKNIYVSMRRRHPWRARMRTRTNVMELKNVTFDSMKSKRRQMELVLHG